MKAGQARGRRLALFVMVALLGACSGHDKPPSTVVDACRMQTERPKWFQAMKRTEEKWGVPVSVQLATIARESSFQHDARPTKRIGSGWFSREVPRSSAYGYAQAIDGTWEGYMRDTGRRRADRSDFADSSDFIGWYMSTNSQVNGVPLRDTYNQYLAYHEGKAGFARGSYRKKAWLPPVARDVEAWATLYEVQLQSCPVR
ncbi:lytic transglycosylase [Amaricoccus sp.]|uniref:transglycosylase SLT domain-containing protein n=1 Tax=Amaricoccus sp. TaxID=1872485 RepID=UPI002609ADE9|nr:lytic transglycosylase [Amaricoccus sp.]HRO11660.1 lytic transglycosylase [Amaricoccus sp.]